MSTSFSISVQLSIKFTPCNSSSRFVSARYIWLQLSVARALRRSNTLLGIETLRDAWSTTFVVAMVRSTSVCCSRRGFFFPSRIFCRALKFSPFPFGHHLHPIPPHILHSSVQTKNDAITWKIACVSCVSMRLPCKQRVMRFAQSWDHHHRSRPLLDSIIYCTVLEQ